MKHVLLTGATGFLGSHLLEALLKQGYQVTILKRSTSDTWRIQHLLGQVRVLDVDRVSVDEVFSGSCIELIIHLATFYRKTDSGESFEEMISANVTFPTLLLETGIKNGIKGFINTGTFFEYEHSAAPISESGRVKPFNFYARTKVAFESLLKTYSGKINTVTLRVFSPYGPKDNEKIIPYILKSRLSGETVELSEGLQKLDFIYCDDVVSAYIKAIKFMESRKDISEVFNIGSGMPTSIREVVSIIEEELNDTLDKKWGLAPAIDPPLVFSDIAKAKEYLKWAPEIGLRKGLLKTMQYYGVLHEDK